MPVYIRDLSLNDHSRAWVLTYVFLPGIGFASFGYTMFYLLQCMIYIFVQRHLAASFINGLKIRIESQMLDITHNKDVWHEYHDGMKIVGFFTHSRNIFLTFPHSLISRARRAHWNSPTYIHPPKCWHDISNTNICIPLIYIFKNLYPPSVGMLYPIPTQYQHI